MTRTKGEAVETFVTKDEAARMLGRSERAVARHAAAGRLTRHYRPLADGGQRAYFDRSEVERLRDELAATHEQTAAPGLAALSVQPAGAASVQALAAVVAEAVARAVAPRRRGPMLLTIGEAARAAGVTKTDIRQAIERGALAVVTLPRTRKQARADDGRRVRPEALGAWVDGL